MTKIDHKFETHNSEIGQGAKRASGAATKNALPFDDLFGATVDSDVKKTNEGQNIDQKSGSEAVPPAAQLVYETDEIGPLFEMPKFSEPEFIKPEQIEADLLAVDAAVVILPDLAPIVEPAPSLIDAGSSTPPKTTSADLLLPQKDLSTFKAITLTESERQLSKIFAKNTKDIELTKIQSDKIAPTLVKAISSSAAAKNSHGPSEILTPPASKPVALPPQMAAQVLETLKNSTPWQVEHQTKVASLGDALSPLESVNKGGFSLTKEQGGPPISVEFDVEASKDIQLQDANASKKISVLTSNLTAGGQGIGQSSGAAPQPHASAPTTALNNASSGTAGTAFDHVLQSLDTRRTEWGARLVSKVDSLRSEGKLGLELSLRPKNLGVLHIRLEIGTETTSVGIKTETQAAAHLLSAGRGDLSQLMQEQGFKLASLSAFVGGQSQMADGQNNRQAPNGKGSTAKSKNTVNQNSQIEMNGAKTQTDGQSLINVIA
ncbi:MAG: flagellar hook-length control protein FliK [Paracoccaceae bacterium]|jgi:flagellar hook-length control protein FliK